MAVHLYGLAADLQALGKIAARRGIAADRGQRPVARRALSTGGNCGALRHGFGYQLLSQQKSGRLRRRRNDPDRFRGRSRRASRFCAITARRDVTSAASQAGTAASTKCRRRCCASSCGTWTTGSRRGERWQRATAKRLAQDARHHAAERAAGRRTQLLPLHRARSGRRTRKWARTGAGTRSRGGNRLSEERERASAPESTIRCRCTCSRFMLRLGGKAGDLPRGGARRARGAFAAALSRDDAEQVDRVADAVAEALRR